MFKALSFIFKSPVRAKVVTYFIRRPGEWGSAADVASIIGSTRETVMKELSQLLRFELLSSRRVDREAVYRVNEYDELFKPLSHFLADVTTPDDKDIIDAFRGIRGITLIVAAGLLTDEPKSSLELVIVCKNPEEKKVEKAVRKLEACAAIPLRYVLLDVDEYYDRRQAYDRMLRDVFEYRHRIVIEKMG